MKEKLDFYSKLAVVVLVAAVLGYAVFKYALLFALPFLFAWFVAFLVRPLAGKIGKRLRISERFLRLLLAEGVLLGTLFLLSLGIWRLSVQAFHLLTALGEDGTLSELATRISDPESMLVRVLPDAVARGISHGIEAVLSSLVSALADFATGFVARVPEIFLFIIITLIAAAYFAFDLDRVNSFVRAHLPSKVYSVLSRFKNTLFSVGIRYIRAYFLLMLAVFSISLTGLLLLGAKHAFLIAIIISVLDVLPAIGVGTVLVPWGVIQIFFGSRPFGIGLIILFFTVELVRQLLEPRIVGKHLGIHPLASLILIWGAFSLFGIAGIILVPVLVVPINALFGKNNTAEVTKDTVRKTDGA